MDSRLQWQSLCLAIKDAPKPPSLFLNEVFQGTQQHFSTKLLVDRIVGTQKLAPFVRKTDAARKVDRRTFYMDEITDMPHSKIQLDYDAEREAELRTQMQHAILLPGEKKPDVQAQMLAEYLETESYYIWYRAEWLAAQALLTGKILYTSEDGAWDWEIDYNVPGSHLITEADDTLWTSANSDPIAQIMGYQDLILGDAKMVPTLMIMGTEARKAFFKHDSVKDYGKNNLINWGQISSSFKSDQIVRQYSNAFLNMVLYEYLGSYEDDDGNTQQYMDPYKVIVIAQDPKKELFKQHFAAINDIF